MTRDISDDLTQTIYDHPFATVTVADAITDFTGAKGVTGGTLNSYLYLDSLTLRAAPEIDSATLTYDIGEQIRLDGTEFDSDLMLLSTIRGKAIRIFIAGLVEAEDIVWFGTIDTITTIGSSDVGQFKVQAVGVLKMAEYAEVHSAVCKNQAGTGIITLGIGLPFNLDTVDAFGVQGNRAATAETDPRSHYVFSFESRAREKWTTQTAVQYLLTHHAPVNREGLSVPEWVLHPDNIDTPCGEWYEVNTTTDNKSLKQLLDELIPRKRAMSYYTYYDPELQKIVVKMFTFVAERIEITLPDAASKFLEANPNKVDVHLSSSIWFENDSEVIDSTDQQYDAVVGLGEQCTSTCTLSFDSDRNELVPDWSTTEEDDYKDGASSTSTAQNARFRLEDKRQHVYSRFRLSNTWNGRMTGLDTIVYHVDPLLDESGTPQPVYSAGNPDGQPMRVRGVKIRRSLPLLDRLDYSDDALESLALRAAIAAAVAAGENDSENIPPFISFHENDLDKYFYLDKLRESSGNAISWSAHMTIAAHEPSLEIKVSSGRQAKLALNHFDTPAPTGVYDTAWAPDLDYEFLFATLCLEFEHRLTVREQIRQADDALPEKILYVYARDARLDYMVPQTIVELSNGEAIISEGGYIRDDRDRLRGIVKATAEWYGRVKRAVKFSYRQVRQLVQIGELVTEILGVGLPDDINTPVTSITYSMGDRNSSGKTAVETGFAEVDFS